MKNRGNQKRENRKINDWRRRLLALVSALSMLISSGGVSAFAEGEEIYSAPVTVPTEAQEVFKDGEEAQPEAEQGAETESVTEPETEAEAVEKTDDAEGAEEAIVPETAEGAETGNEAETDEPEDLSAYAPGTLSAEAEGVTATLDYTAEARMPEGAVLALTRLEGGALYNALKAAAKTLTSDPDSAWQREIGDEAVFYGLSLTDAEGNPITAETGATLTIDNLTIPTGATGFITGNGAENTDWDGTLTLGSLPEAVGYATLKQIQVGTVTLTHTDRDYMVTAAYGPEAGFPANTELKVREIQPGTAEYALYSGMTDEALNEDWSEITLERYFDIAFVSGGEELEPQGNVDVQIVFRDKIAQNDETEVQAVHIENNEANVIEAETDSTKAARRDSEAIDTVTFTTDSFSVYGVVQKKKIITKVLDDKGNTYEIEVTYTQEAQIPENAQVKVEEIEEGSSLWEAYRKQTAAALNADDVRLPGLYDIYIADENGEKVQLEAPVSVAIRLLNAESTGELQVVHFKQDMPQEMVDAVREENEKQNEVQTLAEENRIDSEKVSASVDGDTVTFDAKSFSVYAFAYTVDFHYEDENGNAYEWSFPGHGTYAVQDILTAIDAEGEITNVTLTLKEGEDHEGALYLTQDENGNWFLNSDIAFQDTYELTITTEKGTYVLTVTDATDGTVKVADSNMGYLRLAQQTNQNSVLTISNIGNQNGYNKYRISAIAKDGYGFWKWVVSNQSGGSWDSGVFKTDQIAPGTLEINALSASGKGESFTAYFYSAFRGVDVDANSTSMGYVRVNGIQQNSLISYRSDWKNSNGNNTYSFEAIPVSGYDFVRWDYYRQNDNNPSGSNWSVTNSIYTQVISANTFAVKRNEGWVLKAVFEKKEPYTFNIRTNGNGNLNSKYYYTGSGEKVNTAGTNLDNAKGQFVDSETKDSSRFSYGFTANSGEDTKIAFWTYTDSSGNLVKLNEIKNTTLIPYNNVTFTAYLVNKNQNLFLYSSEDTSKGTVNKNSGTSSEAGATATPASGMNFLGWYDLDGNCISVEQTFNTSSVTESNILIAKFGEKKVVTINVTVNATDYGDVRRGDTSYLGKKQTTDSGRIKNTVTAIPYDGYYFVYWTVNGQILNYDSSTMGPTTVPAVFFNEGDELQAVFMPATVVDAGGNAHSTYSISNTKKQELQQWLNSLQKNVSASGNKTAHVYDEANRIFEIDLTAESTLMDLSANIDIAFILDVSNSMLFPSKLEKVHDAMVLTQDSLNKAFPDGGTYYIISNPTATSTVFKIFKENGIWYFVDASHTDNAGMLKVTWDARYAQPTKNVPFSFPIYTAVGSSVRRDYLNSSLNNALTSLRGILRNIQNAGGSTETIRVAYNTFASTVTSSHDFATLDSLTVSAGDTSGGTRQDLALTDAKDNFSWTDSSTKYAILITDGAPVVGSGVTDVNSETVYTAVSNAAASLKSEKNVELITIGLSTQNVTRGSQLLQSIASNNMFFEAESSDELEYILLKVLQKIMKQRPVDGTVTDTIDPAFYPVTSDGTPIEPGFYNNDGTWKTNQYADGSPCYQWTVNNGSWTITWYNQHFTTYSSNAWVNWSEKIYVKSKEDFLGGNKINTNTSATVQPQWWWNGNEWKAINSNNTITLPVPEVNVKELSFTQKSTEETVSLGATVNPKEKLQALFAQINVNELVSQTGTDHRRTSGSQKATDNGFTAETYLLSQLTGSLTDDQWSSLIAGNTVSIAYSAYNHSNVGTIEIMLTPWSVEGESHDVNAHETAVVASPAEKYTLKAQYVPSQTGASTSYDYTTDGQSAGSLTQTITSTNEHIINVTDRPSQPVRIRKRSLEKNSNNKYDYIGGAKFKLYAVNGTTRTLLTKTSLNYTESDVEFDSDNATLISKTSSGDIFKGSLSVGTYLLEETEAPSGYQLLTAPIEIKVLETDDNSQLVWYRSYDENNAEDEGWNKPAKKSDQQLFELYISNVPTSKALLNVKKNWSGASAPDGASVDVVLGRYKLVDGDGGQSGSDSGQEEPSTTQTDSQSSNTGTVVTISDCSWNGKTVSGTGAYHAGDVLKFTIKANKNRYITIKLGNESIDSENVLINYSQDQNAEDLVLYYTIPSNLPDGTELTLTVDDSWYACNSISISKSTTGRNKQLENGLLGLMGLFVSTAYAEDTAATIQLLSTVPALPSAPTGKQWVKDETWNTTVTLNNDAWSKTVNADATDDAGNVYLYYIDEVSEYNVDSETWTAAKDGQVVWGDYGTNDEHSGNELSITNTVTTTPDKIEVTVQKGWKDAITGEPIEWPKNEQGQYEPASVTVQLQSRIVGSNDAFANEDGMTQVIYPEEKEEQHTTATFSELDASKEYTVVEVNPPAGYIIEITGANNAFTITNKKVSTVNVPLIKTWAAFAGTGYYWTADFELLQKEEYVAGEAVNNAIVDWTLFDPKVTKTIHSTGDSEEDRLFKDLPTYHIYENGAVYRILYSVKETAYEVRDGSGSGTILHQWNETEGLKTGEKYSATVEHKAGELDSIVTEVTADNYYSIQVKNESPSAFRVTKDWLDILPGDLAAYPEVYFTLYWYKGSENNPNQVHVFQPDGANDRTYINIPLNQSNHWTWDCPVALPEKDIDGQTLHYFVIETGLDNKDPLTNQMPYGETILTYPAAETISGMSIKVEGYRSRNSVGSGEWIQGTYTVTKSSDGDTFSYQTENFTKFDQPQHAAIGNTGEIQIRNKTYQYMQMDIKKKFLKLVENKTNNGYELQTLTSDIAVLHDLVLEIQIKRRIIAWNSDVNRNGLNISSGSYDVLSDWSNYGASVLVGYGHGSDQKAGSPVGVNPSSNPFQIRYAGAWHWTIDNQGDDQGLPAYGLFKKSDGTVVPVRYQYILEEVAAYKDTQKTKLPDNEYEWTGVLPAAWDGAGYQVELFPRVIAQDQDRLVNVQTSNMTITKKWKDDTDVQEVYVKVYRRTGSNNGGEKEDFTNKLRTSKAAMVGGYDGLVEETDLYINNGQTYLVIPKNGSVKIEHVLTVNAGKGSTDAAYYYMVEECGYKDRFGTVRWNDEKFAAQYTYESALDQHGEQMIVLGTKDSTFFQIINTPTTEFTVQKKWTVNGREQDEPWTTESGKTIDEVQFRITRIAAKYTRGSVNDIWTATGESATDTLTFEETGKTAGDLKIIQNGKLAQVAVKTAGGTAYTVSYVDDHVANWTTLVDGLQSLCEVSDTEKWVYTYRLEETAMLAEGQTIQNNDLVVIYAVTGGEMNEDGTVKSIQNHGTVTVTNDQSVETEITVTKEWTLNGEARTDKQSIGFQVYRNGETDPLSTVWTSVGDGELQETQSPEIRYVDGKWQEVKISKLPKNAEDGTPYKYYVVETGDSGDTVVTYKLDNGEEKDSASQTATTDGKITIINKDYAVTITVIKVDESTRSSETKKVLQGAEFKLEKLSDQAYAAYPEEEKNVQTSGENGTLTFADLPDGQYRMTETKSPAGYYGGNMVIYFTILNGVITWTDDQGKEITSQEMVSYENATFTVGNPAGAELPATGGTGTMAYTLSGLALMLMAGMIWISRKRKVNR